MLLGAKKLTNGAGTEITFLVIVVVRPRQKNSSDGSIETKFGKILKQDLEYDYGIFIVAELTDLSI